MVEGPGASQSAFEGQTRERGYIPPRRPPSKAARSALGLQFFSQEYNYLHRRISSFRRLSLFDRHPDEISATVSHEAIHNMTSNRSSKVAGLPTYVSQRHAGAEIHGRFLNKWREN